MPSPLCFFALSLELYSSAFRIPKSAFLLPPTAAGPLPSSFVHPIFHPNHPNHPNHPTIPSLSSLIFYLFHSAFRTPTSEFHRFPHPSSFFHRPLSIPSFILIILIILIIQPSHLYPPSSIIPISHLPSFHLYFLASNLKPPTAEGPPSIFSPFSIELYSSAFRIPHSEIRIPIASNGRRLTAQVPILAFSLRINAKVCS